jgi:hypothetical protein
MLIKLLLIALILGLLYALDYLINGYYEQQFKDGPWTDEDIGGGDKAFVDCYECKLCGFKSTSKEGLAGHSCYEHSVGSNQFEMYEMYYRQEHQCQCDICREKRKADAKGH